MVFSEGISSGELVERIERYSARFPELNTNGIFVNLKMTAYLLRVEELFGLEEADRAADYLDRFENLYERNIGLTLDYRLVGEAYSAAAVYYFKKYREDKAVFYLERGLEITPNNFELEYRLRSIRN
jgi:tetratricopeptide (TPR) repeat protein